MLLGGVFAAVTDGSGTGTTVSVDVPWKAVSSTASTPVELSSIRL